MNAVSIAITRSATKTEHTSCDISIGSRPPFIKPRNIPRRANAVEEAAAQMR